MQTSAVALNSSLLTRKSVRLVALLVGALVALLYLEWRSARAQPNAAAEPDTMCFASRIGLSCRE